MKYFLCLALMALPLLMFCQVSIGSESILGVWWTDGKESLVEVYKQNDVFYGKITWLKAPNDENGNPKTDPKNANKELRGRKRLGMVVLTGMKIKEENLWTGGKIYDPKSGKTYSCEIRMKDLNTMNLHGYLGLKAIGRTTTWIRAK